MDFPQYILDISEELYNYTLSTFNCYFKKMYGVLTIPNNDNRSNWYNVTFKFNYVNFKVIPLEIYADYWVLGTNNNHIVNCRFGLRTPHKSGKDCQWSTMLFDMHKDNIYDNLLNWRYKGVEKYYTKECNFNVSKEDYKELLNIFFADVLKNLDSYMGMVANGLF